MPEQKIESFEKFSYLLRPCKQIERRLIVEALLKLSDTNYSIRDYRYIGFGSVYYVDFSLFHKYLYIDDMKCIEKSEIPDRMRFNKPYHFITLEMMPYSDFIPKIVKSKKHFVWLDYDSSLNDEMLDDIDGTLGVLAPGSIFIITIDARPDFPEDFIDNNLSKQEKEKALVGFYREWCRDLLEDDVTASRLTRNEMPKLILEAVREQIKQSLSLREKMKFLQLFNCIYADGAPMLTFGGIIDTEERCEEIRASGIFELDFVTESDNSTEISVPQLTFREKQWLDSNLNNKEQAFELNPEMRKNYRKYYREYPTYMEALL